MIPRLSGSTASFRTWAPRAEHLAVRVFADGTSTDHPATATGNGYWESTVDGVAEGTLYQYVIDGEAVPDPASAYQPHGVHGPSMLVDFESRQWSDRDWHGLPLRELILYEVHIGTFTETGTFSAAIERLDEIRELGATAVEIMPVAEFPGKWNWGYDGVALFAPSHNYGTPEDFRRFVEACHARGLAVLLDVVYNHLGPEGNYLHLFGPFFSEQPTPWGYAPEVGGADSHVRAFFHANARHWIERYHLDGLRFDAVSAIADQSDAHLVNAIAADLHETAARTGRFIHAIGETNAYEPRFLPAGGGQLDALWCDDIGHAAMSAAVGDSAYGGRDYLGAVDLLEALRHGALYERPDGADLRRMPPDSGVDRKATLLQLQNHDIVGNHPSARRLHQRTSRQIQCALAPLVLLYPGIPLIFMGEEFAAPAPFHFFCDFGSESLRRSVIDGRRAEFPDHNWSKSVPPTQPEAFFNSRLPPVVDGHARILRWYRDLLHRRKAWREDDLLRQDNLEVDGSAEKSVFLLNYRSAEASGFVAVALHAPESETLLECGGEILCRTGGAHVADGTLALSAASAAVGTGNVRLRE